MNLPIITVVRKSALPGSVLKISENILKGTTDVLCRKSLFVDFTSQSIFDQHAFMAIGLDGAALLKPIELPGLGPALNSRRISRSLLAASLAANLSPSNNNFATSLSSLQTGQSHCCQLHDMLPI